MRPCLDMHTLTAVAATPEVKHGFPLLSVPKAIPLLPKHGRTHRTSTHCSILVFTRRKGGKFQPGSVN
jgi:hypothetical protein